MRSSKKALIAVIPSLLAGCAAHSPLDLPNPPMAFHDTRLQYALVAGDDAMLAKDFDMKLPPSWAERAAAGIAIPFTAASEAAFFPFATGINAIAPAQDNPLSHP